MRVQHRERRCPRTRIQTQTELEAKGNKLRRVHLLHAEDHSSLEGEPWRIGVGGARAFGQLPGIRVRGLMSRVRDEAGAANAHLDQARRDGERIAQAGSEGAEDNVEGAAAANARQPAGPAFDLAAQRFEERDVHLSTDGGSLRWRQVAVRTRGSGSRLEVLTSIVRASADKATM